VPAPEASTSVSSTSIRRAVEPDHGGFAGGYVNAPVEAFLAQDKDEATSLDVSFASALLAAPLIYVMINATSAWIFAPIGLLGLIATYAIFPAQQTVLVTWVPKERHGMASALNVFFLGGLGSAPAFTAVIVKGLASPELLMEVDITAIKDGAR